jgi:hypothetical protein
MVSRAAESDWLVPDLCRARYCRGRGFECVTASRGRPRLGEADAVITAWVLLGVTAVLVVGNAIFVAADTALVTVDRDLVESRAREGRVRFGRCGRTRSGCRYLCRALS